MPSAVIIDFDDTIVQTSRFRRGLLEGALLEWCNVSFNDETALAWGTPFQEIIAAFVDGEEVDSFIQFYLKKMAFTPTSLCLGAEQFLRLLQELEVPVVILSSSLKELIMFDLKALEIDDMIVKIFGSEDIDCSKPNPDALQLPLEWLKSTYSAEPAQIVYIGDSLEDWACARNQVDFYAVLSGSILGQEFLDQG